MTRRRRYYWARGARLGAGLALSSETSPHPLTRRAARLPGICSSDGVTYDFAGPYTVNEGQLLFGQATRCGQRAPGAGGKPGDSAAPKDLTCLITVVAYSLLSFSALVRFLPLDPRSAAAVLEACRRDAEGEPARYGGAAAAAAGQKTPDVDVAALAAAWDALLAASTRVYGVRSPARPAQRAYMLHMPYRNNDNNRFGERGLRLTGLRSSGWAFTERRVPHFFQPAPSASTTRRLPHCSPFDPLPETRPCVHTNTLATLWPPSRPLPANRQCRNYSLFTNNCHAFVAHFLNAARYGPSAAGGSGGGCGGWNSVNLAALVFLRARYTSLGGALLTWLPFVVIAGVCAYFGRLYFLYAWAGLGGLLVGWFVLHTYALTGVGGSQRPAAGGCAAQPAAGVSSSNGSH